MAGHLNLFPDQQFQIRFQLLAPNGSIVAVSGTFGHKRAAAAAVTEHREYAAGLPGAPGSCPFQALRSGWIDLRPPSYCSYLTPLGRHFSRPLSSLKITVIRPESGI